MKKSFKILVTAHFDEEKISYLQEKYDVVHKPDITYEELAALVAGFDILMVSNSIIPLNKALLEKADRLKIIFRLGIGVDHIDLETCRKKGIKVAITPTANIQPVVELLFSQLIRALRCIDRAEKNAAANMFRSFIPVGREIAEKTIGIIGVGRVGSAIARTAAFFNSPVICYDPYLAAYKKRRIKARWVDNIKELAAASDVVTLHVPYVEETRYMINSDFIRLLKKDTILINYARGPVVHFTDVVEGVKQGIISTYIADVFEDEPDIPRVPPEISDRFYFTPHIGAFTSASITKRCVESISQLEDYINGKKAAGLIDLKKGY